jgi:hypothetical protein
MPERLRPLEASELVDSSFRLYRRNIGLFTAIAAVIYVPFAIFSVLLEHAAGDVTNFARGVAPPVVSRASAGLMSFLLGSFSALLVQATLAVAATDRYLGLPVSFGSAYRAVARRALPLLALFVLLASAIAVGLCACVLPGVVLAIGLAFAPQIVVLEKLSAPSALTRAWHLSRGDRFRLLGIGLVVSIATFSVWTASALLSNAVFRSELVIDLITRLVGLLALPLTHVTLVLVYFDDRVRKEGFDLALLAARSATRPEDADFAARRTSQALP